MTEHAPAISRGEAIRIATRMREGDWSLSQIRDYLARRGVVVRSNDTLMRWTDPEYAERRRVERREAERARWRAMNPGFRATKFDDAEKRRRVAALTAAGLTPKAVAAVIRLDERPSDEPITASPQPRLSPVPGVIGDDDMLVLRDAGLSFAAIAAVSDLFYAVELRQSTVQSRLRRLGVPISAAKSAAATRTNRRRYAKARKAA